MHKVILTIGLLFLSFLGNTCDVCGGVGSNASIGLLASTRYQLFGVRENFRQFSSYMNGIRHSNDFQLGTELFFRVQAHKRIQIMGQWALQSNWQVRDLSTDFVGGIGDPQLFLNAVIIQKMDTSNRMKHFLTLGYGLKAPVGKFVSPDNSLMNLHPGTGAFDQLLMAQYTYGISDNWAIQNEISYSLKGTNKYAFRYGNSYFQSLMGSYNYNLSGYRLITGFGAYFEHHKSSTLNRQVPITGDNSGFTFGTRLGMNFMTYRFLYSFSVQVPILQNINKGDTKQHYAVNVGINYLIKQKQNDKN